MPTPDSVQELPPGLQISPIAGRLAPPSRGLSFLATLVVYGLLAQGLLMLLRRMAEPPPPVPPKTVRVILMDSPIAAFLPSNAGGPKGEGTPEPNAPSQLTTAETPLPTLEPKPQDPLQDPLEGLALAPGALKDLAGIPGGKGTGQGTGVGHGTGTGSGQGKGGMFQSATGSGEALVASPDILHMEEPKYPQLAILARTEGDIVIQVLADVKGHPKQWEIVSGPEIFYAEINRVMPLWRFIPLRQGKDPVQAVYRLVIRFTLKQI